MKKFKAITCALLTAAIALSLTGCVEEGAVSSDSNSGGGVTPPVTTPPATTTTQAQAVAEDKGVIDAVKGITDQLDFPDLDVKKRIKWMAWWDIVESSPECTLFKEVYGIPEEGEDPASAGRIFEYSFTAYGERYTKLAAAIASGSSPDLFPFEILDFPYGVLKGRYQPIDELGFNFDSPKWVNTKDLMKLFELNGRNYTAFYQIDLNNLMYYRKSVIEDAGLEDPRELYEKGEWDWDKFLEMARAFKDTGEGKYVIDGFNPENDFLLSTGVPMVGNDGTQIINNLYTAEVEGVITGMLATLQKENLRYPRHELNGWGVNPKAWADGDILFYADGSTWVLEETLSTYAARNGWGEYLKYNPDGTTEPATRDDYKANQKELKEAQDNGQPTDEIPVVTFTLNDEISFVPFPKCPSADKYYVTLKQDALMWCKGSTNEAGVKAYIDCCATAALDPSVKEASIKQRIKNKGWQREDLEFYYSLVALDGSSPLTPAIDFKGGLGAVSDGSATQNPIQSLTNMVYLTGESFTTLRETHNPAIQAAIDDVNAMIAKN